MFLEGVTLTIGQLENNFWACSFWLFKAHFLDFKLFLSKLLTD